MRPDAPATDVRVPLLDLHRADAPLADEILADIAELIESGAFVNGPAVARVRAGVRRFCGGGVCVGMASGLDALRIGLLAAGVGPGDEVIVPALTFVATLEAVTQAGGAPVVVDVSEDDLCIDPDGRPAAVRPIAHVRSCPCTSTASSPTCDPRRPGRTRGVDLVEDACQAHGAMRDGVVGRHGRQRSGLQLLPGQEPGRHG